MHTMMEVDTYTLTHTWFESFSMHVVSWMEQSWVGFS